MTDTEPSGGPPLPPPTFQTHVFHLASQVSMALGQVENPITKQRDVDLRTARFLIDTIAMLEQKTRGNISDEDQTYISGVMSNLKLEYVKASS